MIKTDDEYIEIDIDEKFVRFILGWVIMLCILGSVCIISWELASIFIELLW